MMDNFWSQSGWRHDDGFAENIFTGVARLGVGVRLPGKILALAEKMYSIKRSETWPHLGFCCPLTKNPDYASGHFGEKWCFDKEQITQSELGDLLVFPICVLMLLDDIFKFTWVRMDSVLRKKQYVTSHWKTLIGSVLCNICISVSVKAVNI